MLPSVLNATLSPLYLGAGAFFVDTLCILPVICMSAKRCFWIPVWWRPNFITPSKPSRSPGRRPGFRPDFQQVPARLRPACACDFFGSKAGRRQVRLISTSLVRVGPRDRDLICHWIVQLNLFGLKQFWFSTLFRLLSCGILVDLFIVALCNRAGHYIFALWFLSSIYLSFFYSSPNLSGHRVDVYHTLAHGVAIVRI